MLVNDGVEFLNFQVDAFEKPPEAPVCVFPLLRKPCHHLGICLQFHLISEPFRTAHAFL